MGEYDTHRVEARQSGPGRGMSATAEHIEALATYAERYRRLAAPPPKVSFAQVFSAVSPQQVPGPQAHKVADQAVLPTPAPGLSHPQQRVSFGIKEGGRIVLKG